jgi:hypothetical protein
LPGGYETAFFAGLFGDGRGSVLPVHEWFVILFEDALFFVGRVVTGFRVDESFVGDGF